MFSSRLVHLSRGDDATAIEDAEAVSDLARKGETLLDDQDREAKLLVELVEHVPDLRDDVGLNPFGRLVEDQELGVERERATHRQLLLLTAREIAASPLHHVLEHGKELEDALGHLRRLVGARAKPTRRFSATLSWPKISRPCGT